MRRRDRGSVLLLIPAGFMIVLMLAAIAVDSAVLHLRQRELVELASAAANDAVGAGIDLDAYRRDGSTVLDPDTVRSLVVSSVEANGGAHTRITTLDVGTDTVRVELVSTSPPLFGSALGRRPSTIRAAVTVAAAERPGP